MSRKLSVVLVIIGGLILLYMGPMVISLLFTFFFAFFPATVYPVVIGIVGIILALILFCLTSSQRFANIKQSYKIVTLIILGIVHFYAIGFLTVGLLCGGEGSQCPFAVAFPIILFFYILMFMHVTKRKSINYLIQIIFWLLVIIPFIIVLIYGINWLLLPGGPRL